MPKLDGRTILVSGAARGQGEQEARLFAEVLAQLPAQVPGARVLATVRGDFFTRLAALPGLGAEVSRALYLLRPLGQEQIREAITGPARRKGVTFESEAMVDALVASAARAAGGLPLLAFALAELWDARDLSKGVIPAAVVPGLPIVMATWLTPTIRADIEGTMTVEPAVMSWLNRVGDALPVPMMPTDSGGWTRKG